MDDDELRENMKPYVKVLVAEQLKRLGLVRKAKDSHFDRLLRPTIVSMAAVSDETRVIEYCKDLFVKVIEGKGKFELDPDFKGIVYGTIARQGDKKEYDQLLKLHNNSTNAEERTILAAALTGFKQPELIESSLALITSDKVRLQDVSYWIAYSFMNRYSRKKTWSWLKNHWEWLDKNLGTDLAFYRLPIYAARCFSEESFADEYKNFFKPVLSPAMDRPYKQGLEIMEYQTSWRKRSLKEIKNFFDQ